MKTRRRFLTSLATSLALAVTAPLAAKAADAPLNVTVSILPQKSMAEAIGGDHVAVTVMVPPGTHPRAFEPSPKQMVALNSAAVYMAIGIPHEKNWMPQVKAARPDMPVVNMIKHVETRLIAGKGKNAGKEIPDPHIWLGPKQLRAMAVVMRDTLSEIAPEYAADFAANAEAWLARLDAADTEAAARLAPYAGQAMLVYHPAFGYMTDAYGLRQIAIEQKGMEPGPRMVAVAIEKARAEGTKVIFVQAQYSEDEARTIAREIDGKVVKLNPLGPDPIKTITAATTALEASFK